MIQQVTNDIWQCSLHIISHRSHSEHELQQKLHYKDYSFDSIETVMNRLREYGYINDRELAQSLVNKYFAAGKYSTKQIIYKLKQRGLSNNIINDVISNYDSDEEWQSAVKAVRKHFKISEPVVKEKIYRYLAAKGFSSASIAKVLQYYNFET
jgi:regulatory protein